MCFKIPKISPDAGAEVSDWTKAAMDSFSWFEPFDMWGLLDPNASVVIETARARAVNLVDDLMTVLEPQPLS